MLKLFKKDGLYGIEENGNDNVPFGYENKEDAFDAGSGYDGDWELEDEYYNSTFGDYNEAVI